MGRDNARQPAPDLFATDKVKDASRLSPKPGAAETATKTAPQRHILPNDLPSAIKHLSDGELDFLHAETLEEMKRRGRMPPGVEIDFTPSVKRPS
jgi:hypothetical protein